MLKLRASKAMLLSKPVGACMSLIALISLTSATACRSAAESLPTPSDDEGGELKGGESGREPDGGGASGGAGDDGAGGSGGDVAGSGGNVAGRGGNAIDAGLDVVEMGADGGMPPVPAVEKPNILMLVVDDLGAWSSASDALGSSTPAIDRLVKRGVRFKNAFAQSPHCAPSRASFLSGRLPGGGRGMALPEVFQQNGYTTARVGKIFHQGVPGEIGTSGSDDNQSWDEFSNPAGIDLEEMSQASSIGSLAYHASNAPDEQHTDGKVAAEAIRLIDKYGDKPFFIAAGFYRPHEPFIAPKKYFDRHALGSVSLPELKDGDLDDVPMAAWVNSRENKTTTQSRILRQAYFASVSFVDAQIGKVLEHLDKVGLSRRTIVVLFGDHGYSLGEHSLWKKKNLFENGNATPLVLAGPGILAGETSNELVALLDLYPTLISMGGLQAPQGFHGGSLVPLLTKNANTPFRKAVLSLCEQGICRVPGKSLRTPLFRYNEWDGGKAGVELYDLTRDPQEFTNLASNPAWAATREQLAALMAASPSAHFVSH